MDVPQQGWHAEKFVWKDLRHTARSRPGDRILTSVSNFTPARFTYWPLVFLFPHPHPEILRTHGRNFYFQSSPKPLSCIAKEVYDLSARAMSSPKSFSAMSKNLKHSIESIESQASDPSYRVDDEIKVLGL